MTGLPDAVVFLVTAASVAEGERIATALVEERLAACANIVEGIGSIYWWKGKVEESSEALLFLKSREERLDALIARVRELHSYENPAIISFRILKGSEDYLRWIGEEVR